MTSYDDPIAVALLKLSQLLFSLIGACLCLFHVSHRNHKHDVGFYMIRGYGIYVLLSSLGVNEAVLVKGGEVYECSLVKSGYSLVGDRCTEMTPASVPQRGR